MSTAGMTWRVRRNKRLEGEHMDDDMNTGELLKAVTEENQTRKILELVKESADKEDAVKKIEALLEK